jgi:Tol biopolymer transport system component
MSVRLAIVGRTLSVRARAGVGAVLLLASTACTAGTRPPTTVAPVQQASEASSSPTVTEAGAPVSTPAATTPDLYVIDPSTGEAAVLVRGLGAQRDAELSPSGTSVVYENWIDDVPQIFVRKASGTTLQLTHRRLGAQDPTWSPDGSRIAFASRPRDGSDADIYVIDAGGNNARRVLGTPAHDGHPSWSPDGERIAFDARYGGRGLPAGGSIVVGSIDSGVLRRLTEKHTPYGAIQPSWSPNGRWIAFSRFRRSTFNGRIVYAVVWIVRPDGSVARRIGPPRHFDRRSRNPSWSPDGRRIVFDYAVRGVSSYQGAAVRTIDVRTGRVRPLSGTYVDSHPSWGPRGIIVSMSRTDPVTAQAPRFRWKPLPLTDVADGIYFLNVLTREAVPAPGTFTSIRDAGNFDVSPDGSMVLFDNAARTTPSDRPVRLGYHQLFVVGIDGSGLRQLTDDPKGASQGSWSPDGTKIVYLGGWAKLCCWRRAADLRLLDLATGTTTTLASGRAQDLYGPSISPDGTRILFTRYDETPSGAQGDQEDLWTMPVTGGEPELLLEDRGYAEYAPDGTTIVFPLYATWRVGNGGGTYVEPWIADADGGHARRIARSGGPGRWSPDGRWIFYRSFPRLANPTLAHTGRGGLHLFDASTGRSTLIAVGYGQDWVDRDTLLVVKGPRRR